MERFTEQNCVFAHEGREYTSGGAFVTDDLALVYISHAEGAPKVTDWHGNALGRVLEHHIGAKRWGAHGYWRMAYVRVHMNGREWYGRYNVDGGQAVRLRLARAG